MREGNESKISLMKEGDESKISLCYPRDLGASPQSKAKWHNLVHVECLYMIKPTVVDFCSIAS